MGVAGREGDGEREGGVSNMEHKLQQCMQRRRPFNYAHQFAGAVCHSRSKLQVAARCCCRCKLPLHVAIAPLQFVVGHKS